MTKKVPVVKHFVIGDVEIVPLLASVEKRVLSLAVLSLPTSPSFGDTEGGRVTPRAFV